MFGKPKFDWFLHDWIKALDIRFPHAWLQKELGYSDGKASNVLTGKKRYDRDLLNDVAGAMKIEPHELLMHPDKAFALRRLKLSAEEIVREAAPVKSDSADEKRKHAG